MVIMQQLAPIQFMSIDDVAELVFKRVLTMKVVYFVTDQYIPGSIKPLEGQKRKTSNVTIHVRIEKKCKGDWSTGRNTWEMIKIDRSLLNFCWSVPLFSILSVAHNFSDWV